jgi:hypothetical protein
VLDVPREVRVRGEVVRDDALRGGEEDDRERGRVLERVEERAPAPVRGRAVLDQALPQAHRVRQAGPGRQPSIHACIEGRGTS